MRLAQRNRTLADFVPPTRATRTGGPERVALGAEILSGFGDMAPGAYSIRVIRADGGAGVVGWLVVSPGRAAAIVNLDFSGSETLHHRDNE